MTLLAIGMPGPFELILLMGVGLLFFGKRLPEVGRSIGQTVVQFKKGMADIDNEIHSPTPPAAPPTAQTTPKIEVDTSTYKFDPHTGEPIKR